MLHIPMALRRSDFDFDLPADLVALRPPARRDEARLLVVRPDGALEHASFRDLPAFLAPPDMIVVNDSKVLAARLEGERLARDEKGRTVAVELTLLRRLDGTRYAAFARPARRLRPGDHLRLDGLDARIESRDGADIVIRFAHDSDGLEDLLDRIGRMPLPPYIAARRAPDAQDRVDYQTVYASKRGSIAAPTAGLHFTDALLRQLAAKGIGRADVTLHVGAGTFLPVTQEDVSRHVMHPERATLSGETARRLNQARAAGGRLVAVGTTALRALETAADESGQVRPFDGETDIFITPGYRFRASDLLVTNFHLPSSTLFMLVCAFCGIETMKRAYREAIARKYRFYSYGDACLLFPAAS
jgi:S-adenosylmethionine:tRNA ribosyltransferase-isomerase